MNAFRTTTLVLAFAAFAACSSSRSGGEPLNPYSSGESDMSSGAFSPEAAQQPGGGSASSADSPM